MPLQNSPNDGFRHFKIVQCSVGVLKLHLQSLDHDPFKEWKSPEDYFEAMPIRAYKLECRDGNKKAEGDMRKRVTGRSIKCLPGYKLCIQIGQVYTSLPNTLLFNRL